MRAPTPRRALVAVATAALAAALAFTGAPVAGAASGAAGPPDGAAAQAQDRPGPPEEVEGLRQTPRVPVRSVPLRPGAHAHGRPAEPGAQSCDKDVDLTGTIKGLTAVAAQDNGICTSADIDTYADGAGTTYAVQAGGEEAAWTHTDVSTPSSPVMAGQFVWSGSAGANTYTPDVKTFRQGGRDYIALSLERLTLNAFCGVVLVDVTDPANPVVETQIFKDDPNDFWCDVHNTFVEDVSGEGRYVYVTADARNDLRVLDIANVEDLPSTCDIAAGCNVEVGRYIAPTASSDNYVHDVTVQDHGGTAGRRVYVSYWDSGLVILDAADVTPGTNPTPLVGPNQIDPAGFLTHHAFASADGSLVFIQDEFLDQAGDEPVQMFDVSTISSPSYVDGLALGSDVPANPAHNLEIRDDLYADRLFVGWYKLGLQAWDFTSDGFVRDGAAPRTAVQYHQAQTEGSDEAYAGAWGVRLASITTGGETRTYAFQSDRTFGLIVDCDGCPGGEEPPPDDGDAAGMHVGDLDGAASNDGRTWTATVTVAIHDADHNPVETATVTGGWDLGGGDTSCTTDETGTCQVSRSGIRKSTKSATFSVDGVAADGQTYESGANHDPDGDSDGTTITVTR